MKTVKVFSEKLGAEVSIQLECALASKFENRAWESWMNNGWNNWGAICN